MFRLQRTTGWCCLGKQPLFTVRTIRNTDTVRTSQETHYVSATKPNRLMLFREIVAVYCENHTEHTDTVRTSQETHYVSATKPNRLMLFRETVAVTVRTIRNTHTVRTSQETHYFSATKINRLMLFRETVAVYCENHTEHTYSSYFTGNTLLLRYRDDGHRPQTQWLWGPSEPVGRNSKSARRMETQQNK
jgi:hypothetical protein